MNSNKLIYFTIALSALNLICCGCAKEKNQAAHENARRLNGFISFFHTHGGDDCAKFLDALETKNESRIKFYGEKYGLSKDVFGSDFKNVWLDPWGSEYKFRWSLDCTLIVISSAGPNLQHDGGADDIIFIIEREIDL